MQKGVWWRGRASVELCPASTILSVPTQHSYPAPLQPPASQQPPGLHTCDDVMSWLQTVGIIHHWSEIVTPVRASINLQ